jgi:arsenate reductase
MREVGLKLDSPPQPLTPRLVEGASLLVTMGCGAECPVVPGLRREDWTIHDPKGQSPARVREIRDEIRLLVRELVAGRRWE